ncbi:MULTISPECIES: DUF427 domain-containing protein [Cyanophyceae]|uniref:DUF427 domain-containing protein n=1 Tax=Leptolyngbya subtilissima DQ-A4 TaxID=2933933 RepID=A0ABV0K9G9_9CYAN|nr:DUF427 domain-containing protein [Nodosilinea sp. FACHB-141]MBD2110739.1 DUF427 domain-containing protein [Nodosilinea sp. FACHB-141]
MAKATWNGVVLAESDACEVVEGNQYFPPDSLNMDYFKPISKTTGCPWKGTASYYDIVVDNNVNSGAAWYYAEPKPAASNIKGYVAFYSNKVKVEA